MYRVWDSPTRWFHWINVLTVVLMVLTGFLFMFRKELAIESVEAKYALLILHVWIGYVFAANLLIRIVWGFVGNRFARWRSVLPTRQTIRALGQDLRDLIARRPSAYLGRSPLGRVAMTLMFLLLLIQAGTGLIQAGAQIFYPPFGPLVARFVAKPGVDPATISWRNAKENVVPHRIGYVSKLRFVSARTHVYTSYFLLLLIVLHVTGVVLTETRQRSGMVSAMFSGQKTLAVPPVDAEPLASDDRPAG